VPDVHLQRRDVLRIAGVTITAATLAACTTSGDTTKPTSASPGAPDDPDRVLRDAVADDELRLAAAYAAVTDLPTGLRTRVTELGARHAVYAAAVRPSAPSGSPGASDTPSSSTPSGASSSATASGSSSTPKPADAVNEAEVALRRLHELERKAAADRAAQSVRATDAELARTIVLAGTGAAGAATVLARMKVAR
jgi:hypothetical protein